jgi:cytochrome c peroxidase
MKKIKVILLIAVAAVVLAQCTKEETDTNTVYPAVLAAFGNHIDLNNLANYANQSIPAYIRKDNTGANAISDAKATLGRILFYDKNLSIDNTISCGSCHIQALAFGDTALASRGVSGGLTGRHSMRLVNARFATEAKFFWDERAATLEVQTTMPIQDHAEMGFSGTGGRPDLDSLIRKLEAIPYYQELFQFVYGNATITELQLQECMAQFVRSIQSFDSKYDAGRAAAPNDNPPFANFTAQENTGKNLFLTPPAFNATGSRIGGGLGCNGCHNAPEFDIDPNTGNNGIIGVLNGPGIDITNTRAPSLRDLAGINGVPNTPMMHTGVLTTLQEAIGHYGTINLAPGNTNLDPRLRPNGFGQQLNLTAAEVDAVIAFLKTLTGSNVYTDAKWSDPF